MNRRKLYQHFLVVLTLLLFFAPQTPGQGTISAGDTARKLITEANDNSPTKGEREEALKKLEEAARLFLNVDEKREAARALNRVGRLHLLLNAPEQALASHNEALSLLKQSPWVEGEVDNLNGLADVYMRLQKRDDAEKALIKAIELCERSEYTLGKAQALLTLSLRQNFDSHPKAVETAQKALTLWQSLDNKEAIASTYRRIGQYYLAQNLLPEATQNCEQALEIWRQLNNVPEQAATLIFLAFIDVRKAEWDSAKSRLSQAQAAIDQKSEPEKMGQITTVMAEINNDMGFPESGVMYFEQALNHYRETRDPHHIWYATVGLGYSHALLQDYAKALNLFEQALAGVEKDSIEAAQTSEHIGRVKISTGEYPAALESLQFAHEIYTRTGNLKEIGRLRALIGKVYQGQGQIRPAREMYRDALETFRRYFDPVNEAAVHYVLGRLEMTTGNYDAAEKSLWRAIEITENMRRVSTTRDLTVAFSGSVHERYQSYIECLMRKNQVAPSQSDHVKAFEMSELAHARTLAEFLQSARTTFALDAQLLEREKALRQSLRFRDEYKARLLTKPKSSKEELKALDAELSTLEANYKEVLDDIRARYPDYDRMMRPVSWNLQRIQQETILDAQTTLLEFSLGSEKSYVWAVTRDSIKSFELPPQASIEEAARKVYNLLAHQPVVQTHKELADASETLSAMILSPVAAELNKSRLIVVADGVLNYIPFQILPSPSANNEPLVARHEIINVPSASILGEIHQLAARRQRAPRLLAAFGDPVFASDHAKRQDSDGPQVASSSEEDARLKSAQRDVNPNGEESRLFYAKRELNNIRDAAGGDASIASEYDATRERFLSTDLTQYTLLHFATHGYLNPQRPESSGFLLSTVDRDGKRLDGFVGLGEIYDLRAPVALVVLSACQTALGKDVRGEGLVGITRGFMYAGASSVVASLWKVDDEATSELMRHFYSNLLQKRMPAAAALREAQNTIRQQPEWSAPYFWAAFTIQGDYRQVIEGGSSPTSKWNWKIPIAVAVALLIVAIGFVWLYRRRRFAN